MITGQTLRDAILSGANNIANQRVRVDELNVFPVPDGDTGTNMSMTIGAARAELEALPDSCTVAEAAVLLASATVQVSGMASSSARAAPMVMLMFVPVSPSGTGKTFSSSTRVRWLAMLLAPERMASRRVWPVIMVSLHLIFFG